MIRLSGLVSSRPGAGAAKNARFYATDENIIYFSTGDSWQAGWPLDQSDVVGTFSLPLAQRPASSTAVGWIFIDSDTGNTYEGFPDSWAPILENPTQHSVVQVEGSGAPVDSAQAALTTALTGNNNDLVFTAVPIGALGNLITVRYLNPGAPSVALSAAIVGNAITVTLATNGSSVITTTAAQIAALSALASLVTVANAGGNNGSGVVTAMSATPLAGGVTGSGAGIAGKGSTYVDYASGSSYRNTGTKSAPAWVSNSSGGSGSIEATTNLIKGDGAGAGLNSGIAAANVVVKQTGVATPTTINELVSCLQAAGLCAAIIFFFSFLAGVPSASATNFGDIARSTNVSTLWVSPPVEQTVGDANATWLSGKDILIATAEMTANRAVTLPAANSAVAGTVRTFIDKVTSTSNAFVRSFNAAGSDTINPGGGTSYALPAGPGSVSFVTDGTSVWTIVYTAAQPAFTDMRDKLVDDQAALLVKPSCALVASSNITLSGNQTIDGVAGTNGTTIILATAQSAGAENGPWVMQAGAWTRPTWYSTGSTVQAKQFMTTFIRLGTTYSGSAWRCTTAGAITIDTTATTWAQTPLAVTSTSVNGLGTGVVTFLITPSSANLAAAVTDETGSGGGVVFATQPTITGLSLANGSTSVAPLGIGTGGSLLTAPAAGKFEADAKVGYYTHAASERGVIQSPQFIRLTANYTLTSQTAVQQMFNATTNGRITLAANTTYRFICNFALTSLSASSGSYGFALGGTATITEQSWRANAVKASALTTATSDGSGWNVAANTTLTSSNTNTTGHAHIEGTIRVGTGGTLIPQVSLSVAAAAVVNSGSEFYIWPLGSDTVTSVGNWD